MLNSSISNELESIVQNLEATVSSSNLLNIQLSSKSNEWYTPFYLADMVHRVLPIIDLDPASSVKANTKIKAAKIITKGENALSKHWSSVPVTVYLNPPGGKIGNKSQTALFWQKLMDLRSEGLLKEAIFMGFSLECLAITQNCSLSVCNFPVVIPRKRIRFVSPEGIYNSPTHSNVIVYVPGLENNTTLFKKVFSELGAVMNPEDPA